jgi:hypothetical protein
MCTIVLSCKSRADPRHKMKYDPPLILLTALVLRYLSDLEPPTVLSLVNLKGQIDYADYTDVVINAVILFAMFVFLQ